MGVELIIHKEKTALLKRLFDFMAQIVAQRLKVYIHTNIRSFLIFKFFGEIVFLKLKNRTPFIIRSMGVHCNSSTNSV